MVDMEQKLNNCKKKRQKKKKKKKKGETVQCSHVYK